MLRGRPGGLLHRLIEEHREQIANAPTRLEERDGRTFVVRMLG